jgi:hypothetical protein
MGQRLSGDRFGVVPALLTGQPRDEDAVRTDCPGRRWGNPFPCHKPIMVKAEIADGNAGKCWRMLAKDR